MTQGEAEPVFACRQCGECCQGAGGILVTPAETRALAEYLGLSPREFARRYLVDSPLGPQVAEKDGACVFLQEARCRVHPVKPRICREWPFLPALLAHPDEFEAAKGACPGLAPASRHQDFVRQAETQGSGA
jgi:hypothetical protein